jgi:hypothetical protein
MARRERIAGTFATKSTLSTTPAGPGAVETADVLNIVSLKN